MKKLFSKRITCLSKTSNAIRLVEVSLGGKKLKVHNFAELSPIPEDPDELLRQLQQLIKDKEFVAKTVHVSLILPETKYKRLTIPVMSSFELKAVVKREVMKLTELSLAEVYFDYKIIHQTYEKGFKRYTVLITCTPREDVDDFKSLLLQAKLHPEFMTSVIFSLNASEAPKRKPLETIPAEIEGYIFLSADTSYVVFMQHGWPLFSREFAISRSSEGQETIVDEELQPQERFRVLTELSRSIQYIQQNFREYTLNQLIFCGRGVTPDLITQATQKEELQKITSYESYLKLDTSDLIHEEDFSKNITKYAAALGVCFGVPFKEKINFIPVPTWIHKFRVAWLGIFLVLFMAGGFMFAEIQDRSEFIEEQIPKIQSKLDVVDTRLSYLQSVQIKRMKFEKIKQLVNRDVLRSYDYSILPLKEISQFIEPQTRLSNLESRMIGNQWGGFLRGAVTGVNSEESKRFFEKFYERLKSSVFFQEITLRPLEIGGESPEIVLRFSIDYQLTPLPGTKK